MKELTPKGKLAQKVECAHLMLWWFVIAAGVSQEESVKKRAGLSCSINIWGRERTKECYTAFYIARGSHPGRMA